MLERRRERHSINLVFQKLLAFKRKNSQPESLGLHFTLKYNYFMLQFISADTWESTQVKECHKSCIVWMRHVLAALKQVWEEAAPVCK